MKFIILMIVLLVVGLLSMQQMAPKEAPLRSMEQDSTHSTSDIPKIPTRPDEVKQFAEDINHYVQQEAAKRAVMLEEAEKH
ncbi:hypothetical protein [Amphritea sp.]|uniref:hypothetical protein n=1 Tax=Amphritea sp. TaxID=1872502 RepID=UPI003A93C176